RKVAQHQVLAILVSGRYDRVKISQHVQFGGQRVAAVHIIMVLARPEKRFLILPYLQALGIHMVAVQVIDLALREIAANHGHNLHLVIKIRRRTTQIRKRAAHNFVRLAKGRLMASKARVPITTKLIEKNLKLFCGKYCEFTPEIILLPTLIETSFLSSSAG